MSHKTGGWKKVAIVVAVVLAVALVAGVIALCVRGGRSDDPSALNDTLTFGAWGEAATVSENAKAESVHSGVTYGAISADTEVTFVGSIANDGNTEQVWYAPIVGFYSGENGVLFRPDRWILSDAPDGEFHCTYSGMPQTGQAERETPFWTVYMDGLGWTSTAAKSSSAYSVTFRYTDEVMSVVQTIVSGGETLTNTYSVRVPEGEYYMYFYGEQCSYTFTSMKAMEI